VRSYWFQHSLIVIETALAVTLLTSGGLLLETFRHLRNTDLGIQREKLLTFETPMFRYADFGRRDAFLSAVMEKIRAIPGVINAGATSQLPLKVNEGTATFYWISGQPKDRTRDQVAIIRLVTRDYFPTIGARLREGRFFETSDRHSDAQAAIVNETFANRNFPGRSAIGAQFKFGNTGEKGYWYRIVGVVREIHEVGMEETARPVVYGMHEQGSNQLMIPPGGEPAHVARADSRRHIRPATDHTHAEHGADGRVRSAGSAAGIGRTVRSAFVRGDAAHQRDRCAHGTGRNFPRDTAYLW
jgi:hypothetical protein